MSGKEEAMKYGFMPHEGGTIFCECGCDLFECYPQGIDTYAEVWGFEYVCTRCGKTMTMYIKQR